MEARGLSFGAIPDRATIDPRVMGGKACIRGTRVPVATIVRCIASGMSLNEVLENYPQLTAEDVRAALQYAAILTEDRVEPLRPTGS